MSWSVIAAGKPAAVKAALAKQFEQAKASTANVPHEQRGVEAAEQIVNGQLDYLAEATHPLGVVVQGSGSAWGSVDGDKVNRSSNFKIDIQQLAGYVE